VIALVSVKPTRFVCVTYGASNYTLGWQSMESLVVLVHSHLVGPFTWSMVTEHLQRRNVDVLASFVRNWTRPSAGLQSESISGGNGHMIRNSPEIIWMPRQTSLPAKFVSGGFLLGAACRRSVPNAKRQSPRITQPVRSPDAIWSVSRQKFAMPRSPTNP
jgi:hypothetical protein